MLTGYVYPDLEHTFKQKLMLDFVLYFVLLDEVT